MRSLVIYGVCLPLAILLGYMLASPNDVSNFGFIGLVIILMMPPLMLRFHFVWMIAAWNMVAGFYFLPGGLPVNWVMIALSFGISFISYVMDKKHAFISVPSMNRPLIFLFLVVVVTARFTGGLGLNVFGSHSIGGKHYLYLFIGFVGYFALTAQKIPRKKAIFYVTLYYIGSITAAIGQVAALISPALYFVTALFPGEALNEDAGFSGGGVGIMRLGGICGAGVAIGYTLLSRFGVQGILESRKFWRLPLFLFCVVLILYGGYRSKVIDLMLLCSVLFLPGGFAQKPVFAHFRAFVRARLRSHDSHGEQVAHDHPAVSGVSAIGIGYRSRTQCQGHHGLAGSDVGKIDPADPKIFLAGQRLWNQCPGLGAKHGGYGRRNRCQR